VTSLRAAGSTDPGQVRTQNQDAFFIADDLVLIADGMGGYAGGEVAAAIAAEVVGAHFGDDASAHGLEDAVLDANRQIFDRGVEPGLEGMGTTLVAVAVVEAEGTDADTLLLANVGDSRCYLLHDGELRQLTQDHSVAAELVRMGRIDEAEGAEHPGRHVLTRVLGVDSAVEPDLIRIDPVQGDRLLLCSDGLSNELTDDEIVRLLAVGTPSDAARALVAAANAHGGLDNITAVVADIVDAPEAPPAPKTTAVPVVAPAAAPPGAAAPLAAPPPKRVLSARERRRRRREDRRERRAWNKWVSLRGAAFVLAFAAVLVGGFTVLRWYGTDNYTVTVRGNHIVIIQGQPGGFLWWPPKVVVSEPFGRAQIPPDVAVLVAAGVTQPTLGDAKLYIANMHAQWRALHPVGPTTTTTTTTTLYTTTTIGGN